MGDLRQEYEELRWSRGTRFPRVWYWRSATALGGRYAAIRLKAILGVLHRRKLRDQVKIPTLLADFRFGFRGVMPEGFRFPFNEDLWLPHRVDIAALPRGGGPTGGVVWKA